MWLGGGGGGVLSCVGDHILQEFNTLFLNRFRTYKIAFMYLRAILCTFQISVDFYYVPVSGRGGGRGGLEKGRGLERGG